MNASRGCISNVDDRERPSMHAVLFDIGMPAVISELTSYCRRNYPSDFFCSRSIGTILNCLVSYSVPCCVGESSILRFQELGHDWEWFYGYQEPISHRGNHLSWVIRIVLQETKCSEFQVPGLEDSTRDPMAPAISGRDGQGPILRWRFTSIKRFEECPYRNIHLLIRKYRGPEITICPYKSWGYQESNKWMYYRLDCPF